MTDKKIIAVVGATGAQGGGLANAILDEPNGQFALRALMLPGIASEDIGRTAFGIFKRGTELVGRTVHISGESRARAAVPGRRGHREHVLLLRRVRGRVRWRPQPGLCPEVESVAAGLRHLAGRQPRQVHGG
jgi:hypothetical protein